MSEFKYACPVCGQHIKCDSSQAGTVMDCPTCFQKITVPQPPANADQKFILTGSQPAEKKIPAALAGAGGKSTVPQKSLPVALTALILVLAAGAGVFFFGGKLVRPPSGWETSDLGSVGAPGAFSQANGTLTVTGAGADIWNQADAFRYVYQAVTGDIALQVRVVDLQDTDPWAKAGLMIRDSPDASSAYALVFVSPASGVAFQQRNGAGNAASAVASLPRLKAPYWLRLTRQGSTFTASASADGTAWQPMNSTTISMDNPVYAGLAVCSHRNGTLCRATFDHFSVNGVAVSMPAAGNATNPAATPGAAPKPAPPKPVAPPANDTNWLSELSAAAIPDTPVAGRIHGRDFIIERAGFQNGTLTLREGTRGPVEFGVTVNFEGAQAESLSGKTINVGTNAEKAARVTLRWQDNGQAARDSMDSGYALRLEFGALANSRLPGKIYLCAPDPEKSYLMGSFNAAVAKPKPKASPKQ